LYGVIFRILSGGGYYDTPLCGHLVIWSKVLETLM
jgi:hypothetical protein